MKRYIKKTYERHGGDADAIRNQLAEDYRLRVPCAVEIIDMYIDNLYALPFTDGVEYIVRQYAKEHIAK